MAVLDKKCQANSQTRRFVGLNSQEVRKSRVYNACMNKREGPPQLKVVGGKEHKPEGESPLMSSPAEMKSVVSYSELVDVYKKRRDDIPADLQERATKRLIEGAAPAIRRWSVAQLHTYLSHPDLWNKPSQTIAVLNEIRERLITGSLEPRK